MVSIRWHFVPNPVSFSKPRFAAKCKTSSVFHTRYDAWNRLVAVKADNAGSPGTTVAQYKYDGLNRRIEKVVTNDWNDDYYYNQDWQIIEDRYESDTSDAQYNEQYIWSPSYVDSPIVSLHDGNCDGNVSGPYNQSGSATNDWRRYYLTDANHNVTTTIRFDRDDLVANTAAIARNVYTAYGSVTQYGANWTDTSAEIGFDGPRYCGYFFDVETGLYQVRNRYYDPGLSTWISRDPVGYEGGDENLYRYVHNQVTSETDPWGLSNKDAQEKIESTWTMRDLRSGTAELTRNPWNAINPFSKGNVIHLTVVAFAGNIIELAPTAVSAGANESRIKLDHKAETADNWVVRGGARAGYYFVNAGENFAQWSMAFSGKALAPIPGIKTGFAAAPGGSGNSPGTYKASPKHHSNAPQGVGKAPTNGQAALDNSVQVKPTSPRRVSVDPKTGEFCVFDRTVPGEFHGHVRTWNQLTPDMKKALIDAGKVTSKGKIK